MPEFQYFCSIVNTIHVLWTWLTFYKNGIQQVIYKQYELSSLKSSYLPVIRISQSVVSLFITYVSDLMLNITDVPQVSGIHPTQVAFVILR